MGGEASTLPLPPSRFDDIELPLVKLPAHKLNLFRCHKIGSAYKPESYNFSPSADGRFNAPDGEFGTLYVGCDPHCAFIEGIGHDFILGETRVVSKQGLQERCICHFHVNQQDKMFTLVNLTDGGSKGYGALNLDNQITTSKDREVTQQWALSFWKHKSMPDGILYRACNDVERFSIAMFHRAGDVFAPSCEQNLLADPFQLGELLDHYLVGLIDD